MMSLFPTPVGLYKLEKSITKKELGFLIDLERTRNVGNFTSLNRYLHQEKKFARIAKFFMESANDYLQRVYAPSFEVSLRLTQTWANFSDKGEYHHQHKHPNSFISGVFYAQCNSTDKIYFHNPKEYFQIDIVTENFNIFNSKTWYIENEENLLLLFPSELGHSVETVTGEKTRISVSFNTFPVGNLGDPDRLTECKL